jgi:hypothetical protein
MLCEQMSRSQIRWGISEPHKSRWTVFWYLLFFWFASLKILRCWFYQRSNQPTPFLLSTNATFFSPIIRSLSVSCSPLLVLSSSMFHRSAFHINIWQIWCWDIIDCNKLTELTMSFHLGIAHNINLKVDFFSKTDFQVKSRSPSWPGSTSPTSSPGANPIKLFTAVIYGF